MYGSTQRCVHAIYTREAVLTGCMERVAMHNTTDVIGHGPSHWRDPPKGGARAEEREM